MTSDGYGDPIVIDENPRCWRCDRLLAELVTRPWRIKCSRCKAKNGAGTTPFEITQQEETASTLQSN